jgi:hypothetical protein
VPVIVALAAGGVGLAVGGVFGALALGKRGTLDQECTANKICPPSAQGTLDSLKTMSTVSTIAFIAGGVGVAAGVVLFVLPSAHGANKAEQGIVVRPYVWPLGAGVAVRF